MKGGDEQIQHNDLGTIWSTEEDSEIATMTCTKVDYSNVMQKPMKKNKIVQKIKFLALSKHQMITIL